jgi:hypothetical protein
MQKTPIHNWPADMTEDQAKKSDALVERVKTAKESYHFGN